MSDVPPPKRGKGRPRKRPTELIRLRCDVTPDEYELVSKACTARGVSKSDFTRESVVKAAQKLVPPKPKKPRK